MMIELYECQKFVSINSVFKFSNFNNFNGKIRSKYEMDLPNISLFL